LPKGYSQTITSGDHAFCYSFTYPDSSIFYISTFANTDNYRAITEQGLQPNWSAAIRYNDTITVSGQDKNGLYWKDQRLQDGTIFGYSKASKAKAIVFNQAFETIRKTK
jgi:hypothetical protein